MKIAVGLSGGVDSSVAALLLKRAGHDVVGVTMKLWRDGAYPEVPGDACFGPGEKDDIAAASEFAKSIGIGYEVFDCSDRYESTVLGYFRRERSRGRTPNPCVVCNRTMKFGLLPEVAAGKLDFDFFATGHYARIEKRGGRFVLLRAADAKKDQSYFLWGLSQKQLSRAMFPLGSLTKSEVRRIALEAGLSAASKKDSQDFYSGDQDDILPLPPRKGEIVTVDGKVVAGHDGYWHFTIGQRKGLGFAAGSPMYVCDIDACRNRVVVGTREDAVKTEFSVTDVNWVSREPVDGPFACRVKVRSTGEPAGPAAFDRGRITVPGGIFGVAPGQSAVVYAADSDELVLGGVI
jgi:tRNA-specific 2-thiouridylase